MLCRSNCGVCCTAISISSPIPGLPAGKPAGVRCPHLSEVNLCKLFGQPQRPRVCSSFEPMPDVCGGSREEAFVLITRLEEATKPASLG